ncbi:TIM barrel protein [Tundrisphaera lichenicola]|uniref:TIM barrel protein n=1 Tax=Tundrisphaera lichenicola TaxID=2029860 RepID=UPI003EC08F56
MIRSAVTVSLVEEARNGPFVFWHDLTEACKKAQQLGFDAVEVFPTGPDAVDSARLRILLNDHGLSLAAVGTGAGWVRHKLHLARPDAEGRVKARDFIRSIIDFAGPLHAPAIIGSMQGRSGEGVEHPTALGYLADALEDLGEHARQYGVPLIYEPLNRYETDLANTLDAGLKILRSLSTANVTLLADLFHMNIEEFNVADSLRAAGKHIGHVHFVDSNRRAAGFGHTDFAPIAQALHEVGFRGYASAEAFPLPNPETAALQTMHAFRRYFRAGADHNTP